MRLGPAKVRFTGRAEGDLGHAGAWVETPTPEVQARRDAVHDGPWTWLRQVHGDRVVVVAAPGDQSGQQADAAVTGTRGAALSIFTADCAPIALASDDGVIGAAHAGWKGLQLGVIAKTVEGMRSLGAAGRIQAALGPCIHPECYEFGQEDLDAVAAALGDEVRGLTKDGSPALDVPAAVKASLDQAGVEVRHVDDTCTACSPDHFSYRARQEMQRQALVVWLA